MIKRGRKKECAPRYGIECLVKLTAYIIEWTHAYKAEENHKNKKNEEEQTKNQ